MDALDKKNSDLANELLKAQKNTNDTIKKLQEFEHKCYDLQQNVNRCFSEIHQLLQFFNAV